MKNTTPLDLNNSTEVRKLMQVIEEAARSTEEGVKYYVEPGGGMLDRTMYRAPLTTPFYGAYSSHRTFSSEFL